MESDKKRKRQMLALLQLMSQHVVSVSEVKDKCVSVIHRGKALMKLSEDLVTHLRKEELAQLHHDKLSITETGRAFLVRQLNVHNSFQSQQQMTQKIRVKNEDGALESVTVHVRESPLAWLRTRKHKDGAPLLSEVQFAAGEKLRADFTRASLSPRVTSSWDISTAQRQRGLPGTHEFSEGALAAKERVNEALKSVGTELNGVLLDICCFLKSLKDVELERRWPARTAKVILSLALDRLAAHYGLMPQAQGVHKKELRSWGARDYRPVITY